MLQEGGIYTTRVSWGRWTFVRVLKLTEGVAHLRLYNRKSWRKPSFARFDRDDWLLGHLPISLESVARWEMTYIGSLKVDEGELEGYRIWDDDESADAFA
jgi:hypothetical protein